MLPLPRVRDAKVVAFGIAFVCALLFALFTQHAWEDYYITYRASKNLATGHGLVFNVGERLHTFTSPIGVLLPALASLLTFNTSDSAALWIFRCFSCVAFGTAAALAYVIVRRAAPATRVGATLTIAWICTDSKCVDFTINGMETGFMLMFVGYAMWAHFVQAGPQRWLHLGLAWAGLMWTRPDSFIYIGLLAAGAWLFNDRARSGFGRGAISGQFLKAGAVCTLAYLPWFAGAWFYYGSPIPHTIIAKASVSSATWSVGALVQTLLKMPQLAWHGSSTIDATFLPTYYVAGGWPTWLIVGARALGCVTACLWLFPRLRSEARTASLAFFGAHVYLTFFPYFPFPWYLPPTALLAFLAWGVLCGQLWESHLRRSTTTRPLLLGAVTLVAAMQLFIQAWFIQEAGRQMAALQTYVDHGNRRLIGEWLAQNSQPGDRVFLEPLGYIGFFSGLKIYDWPGLSSREVVEAHAKVGSAWAAIVDYLGPDWLVLRPEEVNQMQKQMPRLLTSTYEKVKEFDVRPEIQKLSVRGRHLLEMDALFMIFHRKHAVRYPTELGEVETRYPDQGGAIIIEDVEVRLIHAPGSLTVNVPATAKQVRVAFGFRPGAGEGDPVTDGAGFQIVWSDGQEQKVLSYRELHPETRAEDRHVFFFDGDIPTSDSGSAKLMLRSIPGKTDTKDWTCWGRPEFR